MKTYVSIDMDFFNGIAPKKVDQWLDSFFARARRRKIPMVAVMNHQQLTRFVDKSGARKLVNIDRHSDLTDADVKIFNCGTWVSYVRWRHKGQYHWFHRHVISDGECSWENPVFMDTIKPRGHITEWSGVHRTKMKHLPNVSELLRDCTSIGLVLSPWYVRPNLEPVFRKCVDKYNMRYYKGVRDENTIEAKRNPPFRRKVK